MISDIELQIEQDYDYSENGNKQGGPLFIEINNGNKQDVLTAGFWPGNKFWIQVKEGENQKGPHKLAELKRWRPEFRDCCC